ncbi:hypothetical protein Bca52824_053416 [Brassica carinata]|uniref:Uncharacterized protein n=1 Tax=Brassica carinata TaxID=52824 RepID=A0A8X7ULP6_BRACI|nr:hypothetical protein Bca52824_053416 [Brassica carinata]
MIGCKAGYVSGGAEGRFTRLQTVHCTLARKMTIYGSVVTPCGAMGMDMVTKGVHNVIEFLSDDFLTWM